MNEIDLRLIRAAIVLAYELNFSRAAERLNISQPALTKQIQDLEALLNVKIFLRSHQRVSITEAGKAFLEEAKLVILHHDRAIQVARAVQSGAEALLHLGQSPRVNPLFTSVMGSIRLPLYPDFRLHIYSDYGPELNRKVATGELDLAITLEPATAPSLTSLELGAKPLYVTLEQDSPLAEKEAVRLEDIAAVPWIIFPAVSNPRLYELIQTRALVADVAPPQRHHVTTPEQAAQLVLNTHGVAFLSHYEAWKVAVAGLTMRPLDDPEIRVRTVITARSDAGALVSEFIRATARKLGQIGRTQRGGLPIAV